VTAVAGFRYGADPLDNPGADPPLRQTTPSDADVTPTLWTLTKTYLGPEDETATGRNYPRRYRLDVDIADGQPVTNLQITWRTTLLPGLWWYSSRLPLGAFIGMRVLLLKQKG
jgi:hypothetical protein